MAQTKKDESPAADVAKAWRAHPKAEVHADVAATSAQGRSEKDIEVHAADGVVLVNTHGEARLDRESLITLRKRLDEAFQVVA